MRTFVSLSWLVEQPLDEAEPRVIRTCGFSASGSALNLFIKLTSVDTDIDLGLFQGIVSKHFIEIIPRIAPSLA